MVKKLRRPMYKRGVLRRHCITVIVVSITKTKSLTNDHFSAIFSCSKIFFLLFFFYTIYLNEFGNRRKVWNIIFVVMKRNFCTFFSVAIFLSPFSSAAKNFCLILNHILLDLNLPTPDVKIVLIAVAPLSINRNQILFFYCKVYTNLQLANGTNKASKATRARHM